MVISPTGEPVPSKVRKWSQGKKTEGFYGRIRKLKIVRRIFKRAEGTGGV